MMMHRNQGEHRLSLSCTPRSGAAIKLSSVCYPIARRASVVISTLRIVPVGVSDTPSNSRHVHTVELARYSQTISQCEAAFIQSLPDYYTIDPSVVALADLRQVIQRRDASRDRDLQIALIGYQQGLLEVGT